MEREEAKSLKEVERLEQEHSGILEEKDKQIEALTKEYNDIVKQYQKEQEEHETLLDHIMAKVNIFIVYRT